MRAGKITDVRADLLQLKLLEPGLLPRIEPLRGGRSNAIWRVRAADGLDCIVKYFCPSADNPLFPNRRRDELAMLRLLDGRGAPRLLADLPAQRCVVMSHIDGQLDPPDVAAVARALARLHRQVPPADLRKLPLDAVGVLAAAEQILQRCPPSEAMHQLQRQRPRVAATRRRQRAVLVHSDCHPLNMLQRADGEVVLIDWQCPAAGSALEDLACYLSPLMRAAYGVAPASEAQQTALMQAYAAASERDLDELMAKLAALQPAWEYRMAAYELWRGQRRESLREVQIGGG